MVTAEQVDVRDAKVCAAAVNQHRESAAGRIDVLVNNSGIIRDNLLPAPRRGRRAARASIPMSAAFSMSHVPSCRI